MKYNEAKIGRVFVALLEDGEDLLVEIKELIRQENLRAGFIHLVGATGGSKMVLGPEKKEYPPKPHFFEFDDAREFLGLGIFAWEGEEPKIHLHAGIGHSSSSEVGCIREKSKVYITTEVVIQEIIDIELVREIDPRYNASLLKFAE